jgi:hypothetical protein
MYNLPFIALLSGKTNKMGISDESSKVDRKKNLEFKFKLAILFVCVTNYHVQ